MANAEQSDLTLTEEPPRVSVGHDDSGETVVASPVRIEDDKGEVNEIIKCNSSVPLRVTTTFAMDMDIWLFQGKPRKAASASYPSTRSPISGSWRTSSAKCASLTEAPPSE